MEHERLVSPASRPRRAPGRPRSDAAHDAILTAAIALVREVGYDAVTMDGIAARAGVGKATVYRRWAGKETLVADGIERIVAGFPAPDTGTVRGDLAVVMRYTMAMYADPATTALLSALVAAMARSAPIADAVRRGFVGRWRDVVTAALERGVARGELRADADLALAIELIAGPLFHRFLITGGAVDEALAHGVVDVVLRGLAPDRLP